MLLVALSCEKDGGPVQPNVNPALSELEAPELVSPAQTYLLRVKATDPQGRENLKSVTVTISKAGEQNPVVVDSLFDDGAYFHPDDGDVVAGDGIYSQRILWQWSSSSEEVYRLVFVATDLEEHRSEPLEWTVRARKNDSPVLLRVEVPAVLPSGFEGTLLFRAEVADSQGVVDVAQVTFDAFQQQSKVFSGRLYNDGSHGDAVPGDAWFELAVTAAFSAGRKGQYVLRFRAVDRLSTVSQAIDRDVVIENEPPVLGTIVMPDTVAKPTTGSVAKKITAAVLDPQSLADVKAVGFTSLKPDSTFGNNGLPIPLVDNGLPFDPALFPQPYYGDEVAGDGVYTFTLVVYSDEEAANSGLDPVQTGLYRFTFEAEDWVGQKSEPVVRTLVVR